MTTPSRQPLLALPRAALGALAVTLTLAAPARAAQGQLRQLELSGELYAVGLAEHDPLFLIAAAKLRRSYDFQPAPGQNARGRPITWEAILDAARDMAYGDEVLTAMIDDMIAEGTRGVTTGQIYSIAEIGIGGLDVYDPLTFAAGQYAEVYVEATSGTNLKIYVYDAAGNLVCADTDDSPVSYCGWRPSEAGEFVIKVENAGEASTGYALMTN